MNRLNLDDLGKWMAVITLIIVSTILELHHLHSVAHGFETAGVLLVVLT